MANRTLRWSRKNNDGDAGISDENSGQFSNVIESDGRDESNGVEREQNDDREPDGNRADSLGEPDESRVIGRVEIDPAELDNFIVSDRRNSADNGDDSQPRKRRGRKPGSKNKSGSKKAQETIEPFLMTIHIWASVLLKCPELMLDNSEAKKISDAYANFCEYHEVPVMSAKRMSELNLIVTLGIVYLPRLTLIKNRKTSEKLSKKNVQQFVA